MSHHWTLVDRPTIRPVVALRAENGHELGTATRIGRILETARQRLVTVREETLLPEVARLLASRGANLLVVCDKRGLMSGVVTKTDLVSRIGTCQGHTCMLSSVAVMTRDVFCWKATSLLEDVWATMKQYGFREAPVVDDSRRPIGIVSARDALHALIEEIGYEEALLRDYVMGNGYH